MSILLKYINAVIQIIFYILICISICLVMYKQNNLIEKLLLNLVFLMIGTVSALGELYLAVVLRCNETIYLRKSIVFSLIFISTVLILMLYNMYFIWRRMNKIKYSNYKYGKWIYSNRFILFIITISLIVIIIISAYGFIYYIINNLPSNIVIDLKGNFMDKGDPKRFGECVYFSAVTFFTVGYGDMVPRGLFCCGIVIFEMLTSYILSIISIPILLSILLEHLSYRK